jgi:hypothetical protein
LVNARLHFCWYVIKAARAATSCCALVVGFDVPAPYNRSMAWYRTLLALVFLISTVLGNVGLMSAISAPMAGSVRAVEMNMPMPATSDEMVMPEKCGSCKNADAALAACGAACVGGVTLPAVSSADLVSVGLTFDRPADQQADGPIYSPDPHPPKPYLLI